MKQVTVPLSESLERQLDAYLETHPESAANVMQTALKAFLEEQMWAAYRPEVASVPFHISPADIGGADDGTTDVSVRTGHYLAEALHKPTRELDLPTFDGDVDADASINHDAYTSKRD